MSVYLGEQGTMQILRTAGTQGALRSVLDPADVSVAKKRFSFDFPAEALISGDRIEIYTTDKSNLELVAGHSFPDGEWYCHIDDAGGVRLYDSFDDAVNGGIETALTLISPSSPQEILVHTRNGRYRCYSQMRTWELTTERSSVDITALGEEFVSQFSRGLISGQGSAQCIWDYRQALCDPMQETNASEEPHYLCELLMRLKQGALFRGRFYVFCGDPSVWYECDCVVTNCGLTFAPGAVVESTVQFVTTGPIELHTGQPEGLILQEDTDLLLQENADGLQLEDPD